MKLMHPKLHLFCITLLLAAGTSVGVAADTHAGVGAKPVRGAEIILDGSREMLDKKWTYWEGPRFASSLAVRPLWHPHPAPASRTRLSTALKSLAGPYAALCVMALGLGLVEVGVPAVAILEQNRAASGWLLALWSLGSLVGGLVASRVHWRRGPAQRWPWLLTGVTVGTATIVVGANFGLAWLGFTLFLSGLALAPSLAAGYGVIGDRAAAGRRTDAFAWTTTFLLLGFGGGAAIGGILADISPTWTFTAGTAVTAFAAVIASFGVRRATVTG